MVNGPLVSNFSEIEPQDKDLCFKISTILFKSQCVNALSPNRNPGPRQNGRHFASDLCKCIFFYENCCIWFKFYRHLLPGMKLTIDQHYFGWWLGADQAQCVNALSPSRNPDGTKPLPEPMLTDHQWSPMPFMLGQFHKRCLNYQSLKLFENYMSKI